MTDKEKQIDTILKKIAYEISITPTMLDKAVDSYESVGKWLSEGILYEIIIMPQGSINLGTTNKPISDKDDYDIDLVCLLKNGQELSASEIKNIVGNRLKENKIYYEKILKEGEGKRCWKMQYNEFHMDILPCVPKSIYKEPDTTDVRLTHKINNTMYEDKYSNPYGYHTWFEKQMKEILEEKKKEFALNNKMEIKDVPTYKVKTPLQMAVQILKRHRDVFFQSDKDNAPISIIITTLAAKAYCGENNLFEALSTILTHMADYIEIKDGDYWITNPAMSQENFADKWKKYPIRRDSLLRWIKHAENDLLVLPLKKAGIDEISKHYEKVLGEAPVKRAITTYADEMYKARKNNKLYSAGLTNGLTVNLNNDNKRVKDHTFYD